MDRKLIVRAPAKINLGLTVLRRRLDGYHDLETVMQQISLADSLLLESCSRTGWSFFCTDRFLAGPENLVCRAAELLANRVEKTLPGVRMTLYKNVPVSAGLAGGSSDAAAALRGLNYFWRLGLSEKDLMETGLALGSDLPYCLRGGTVLATGRGEKLADLPALPFFWVVLALLPAMKVSTAEAYRSLEAERLGTPSIELLVEAIQRRDRRGIRGWIGRGYTNTLETVNLPGSELIRRLKDKLCRLGLGPAMSGSGPTLFMLFDRYSEARSAIRAVENASGRAYLCWTTTGKRSGFDV